MWVHANDVGSLDSNKPVITTDDRWHPLTVEADRRTTGDLLLLPVCGDDFPDNYDDESFFETTTPTKLRSNTASMMD
jgi:hypothetical protein